jgi:hypothetical protein
MMAFLNPWNTLPPLLLQSAAQATSRLAMTCIAATPFIAPGILSIHQGDGDNSGGGGKGDDRKVDLGTSPDAAAATKGSGVLTLKPCRQREMSFAQSYYREMKIEGFKPEGILSVAAELIGFVTEAMSMQADIPLLHAVLSMALCKLPFSDRITNCLYFEDIRWLGQLVLRKESHLLKTQNMGKKSIAEIKEILADLSARTGIALALGMRPEQLHGWQPPQG